MKKTDYKSHIFALSMIFTMGNAVIIQPFYTVNTPFPVFILSVVFTLLFAFLSVLIADFLLKKSNSAFKKALNCIIYSGVLLLSLWGAASAAYDCLKFITKIQLPEINIILPLLLLVGMSLRFAFCKGEAILKFCLFMTALSLGALLLLFISCSKTYQFDSLLFDMDFKTQHIKTAFKCFLKYFSPIFIIPLFIKFENQKITSKNFLSGILSGFIALFLTLVQTVFTLGKNFGFEYPYIYAVSAFSSGSLFTRLDGFVYLIFFAVSVIKIGVCIKTVRLIIKNAKTQQEF